MLWALITRSVVPPSAQPWPRPFRVRKDSLRWWGARVGAGLSVALPQRFQGVCAEADAKHAGKAVDLEQPVARQGRQAPCRSTRPAHCQSTVFDRDRDVAIPAGQALQLGRRQGDGIEASLDVDQSPAVVGDCVWGDAFGRLQPEKGQTFGDLKGLRRLRRHGWRYGVRRALLS
jgi:hypothetical protein